MPKVSIRFNLPEEEEEHRLAMDAWKWKALVEDYDQWLRSQIRYHQDVLQR